MARKQEQETAELDQPVEDQIEEAPSESVVRYTGRANRRILNGGDLASLGAPISTASYVWEDSNGFRQTMPSEAAQILVSKIPDFVIGN